MYFLIIVCPISALCAEIGHVQNENTALPKAEHANCVHPFLFVLHYVAKPRSATQSIRDQAKSVYQALKLSTHLALSFAFRYTARAAGVPGALAIYSFAQHSVDYSSRQRYRSRRAAIAARRRVAAVLAVAIVLLSALMARAWRRPPADAGTAFFEHAGRFALALAMIVAYLAALPHAGFFTASAALALAMPFVLGYRNLPRLGLAGAIFLAAVWAIFVWIFQRPLPREFFLAS